MSTEENTTTVEIPEDYEFSIGVTYRSDRISQRVLGLSNEVLFSTTVADDKMKTEIEIFSTADPTAVLELLEFCVESFRENLEVLQGSFEALRVAKDVLPDSEDENDLDE